MIRIAIARNLRDWRKFSGAENSRIWKFLLPRRKDAKFGGEEIFLRILLTIFSDLSGPFDVAQDMLGVFAGDIPSFGCGGAAPC
jgi:hypothetical protein